MDHVDAVVHQVPEFRLIARNPEELELSRTKLIAFATAKLDSLDAELKLLEQNLAIAKSASMKTTPIVTRIRLTKRRITYYEKVQAALVAGFHIVPNFDADVFAIRTTQRTVPNHVYGADARWPGSVPGLSGSMKIAPLGEGDHVSNRAEVSSFNTVEKSAGDKEVTVPRYYGSALIDEIDFPFALARPEVLTATQQVMAMKIFDELAVLPQRRPTGDPMVVGIIKEGNHFSAKRLTFLVVWFLDTNTI